MEHAHIIVVDDEAKLRELIRDYLSRHGFAISTADNSAAMRAILTMAKPFKWTWAGKPLTA